MKIMNGIFTNGSRVIKTNLNVLSLLSDCYEANLTGTYIIKPLYTKNVTKGVLRICRPVFKADALYSEQLNLIIKIMNKEKLDFNVYLFRIIYAASVNTLGIPYEDADELKVLYNDMCNIGSDLTKTSEIFKVLHSGALSRFTDFLWKKLYSNDAENFFEILTKALDEMQPTDNVNYRINDKLQEKYVLDVTKYAGYYYDAKMLASITYSNGETEFKPILFLFTKAPDFCENYKGQIDRKSQSIRVELK